jgi:hypothetical protein
MRVRRAELLRICCAKRLSYGVHQRQVSEAARTKGQGRGSLPEIRWGARLDTLRKPISSSQILHR